MTREVWNQAPSSKLSDFVESPRYWQVADAVSLVDGASSPTVYHEYFAARFRALITPTVSGEYTFWIASDDESELYLSPNASKFGRVKIASVTGWVAPLSWDQLESQKSRSIHLVAGQSYFMEVLHKQGPYFHHCSIAWQSPGGNRELIPAAVLTSYSMDPTDLDNDELADAWEAAYNFSSLPNAPGNLEEYASADPDADGFTNLEESLQGTSPHVHGGIAGCLLLESWNHVDGASVEDLTWNAKYLSAPDQTLFVESAQIPEGHSYSLSSRVATTPPTTGDYWRVFMGDDWAGYGARLRGYVIAPVTGSYRFYIAGDDAAQLWLSPSNSQFDREKIAYLESATNPMEWDKFPSQTSVEINLVAGQKYYLEAILKQQFGDDHMQIGWATPGSPNITVIPSAALESYAYDLQDPDGDNLPSSWESSHGLNPLSRDAIDPDRDGISNQLEFERGTNPNQKNIIDGGLTYETWPNIEGRFVANLTAAPAYFLPAPQASIATMAQTPCLAAEAFGSRLRGYITPPVSGNYTFWALGDDEVELWLSPSDSQFQKTLRIRVLDESASFDDDISQQSNMVSLVAGQKYFIEILHKDNNGMDVSQIAWTLPNGLREVISSNALSSFIPTPDDLDDDCLPDAWEIQQGLDATDNGRMDPQKQGERGDFDSDGLNNRTEYIIGSEPNNPDTDGDGERDGVEYYSLGTNALVLNSITDRLVNTVNLGELVSSTVNWVMTSGGLLSDSFRGEGTWNFTVPSDGNWLLRLDAELVGSHYGDESVPVIVKVNGQTVTRKKLNFGSGNFAVLRALTPWLTAGQHQVSIMIDNAVARRSVRLVSLKVYESNSSQEILAASNRILPHSATSRVSPAFVEGFARHAEGAQINNVPVTLGTGDGHWFANVSLPENGTNLDYTVAFEQGHAANDSISWQATNAMLGESLIVRAGDSLRIGAWSEGNPTATLSSSSGNSWQLNGTEAVVVPFPVSGIFYFNAASGSATAQLSVKVVASPNFSPDPVDLLDGAVRHLTFQAASGVVFDLPQHLGRLSTAPHAANQRKVSILAGRSGDFHLAARLGQGGPILGIQRCNVILISDALQNDLTSSSRSDVPGYRLFTAPLTVLNFPVGARIDVRINRAGVMFPDGSSIMQIGAADFNNGWAPLSFLFPVGMGGGYCHSLLVYDRHGVYLGMR